MVEAAPSCALLGGFAIGARVVLLTRTLVTSLRPSRNMTTQCERSAGSARTAGQ